MPQVNVGDENGQSSMHMAVKGIASVAIATNTIPDEKAMEMMRILVQRGAFCDYANSFGKRPINECIDSSDQGVPMCDFLLALVDKSGTRVVDLKSIRPTDGNSLLHDAAWSGNTECMRKLLATNAFGDMLESTNKQGQTALHCAAFRAPKEVNSLLIDAGASHTATERNPRRTRK